MEQIHEGGAGGHGAIPGIAPGFMIQIAAFPVIGDGICDQLGRSYRVLHKKRFDPFNSELFFAGFVGQSPAAETQRPDRAVYHSWCDLEIIPVGNGVVGLIDACGQKMRNKLQFLSIEADTGRLVELGRLFLFVFPQKNGIQFVFQMGMLSMVPGRGIINVVADPPVDIRMADRVSNVVVDKAGQVGDGFLFLLAGMNQSNVAQAALEKFIDLMLMHVGSHISIIPVPQDGDIIEKHIRSLKSQLIEPTVFGNNVFQRRRRQIVVGLHSKDVMSCKAGQKIIPSLLI